MKLATWNVNSLTVRLPQVLDWLAANPVDVLALQELKCTDDKFPHEAFAQAGYQSVCFGQKTYNGVALITKASVGEVTRNIPSFDDDMARVISGVVPHAGGDIQRGARPPHVGAHPARVQDDAGHALCAQFGGGALDGRIERGLADPMTRGPRLPRTARR